MVVQSSILTIPLPQEPDLEKLVALLNNDQKESLPEFHELIGKVRKKALDQARPEIFYLPELHSLLGSPSFAKGIKNLSKKLQHHPDIFEKTSFTCWKTNAERDEAYLNIIAAFKTGRLSLDEAQIFIAPHDFMLFFEEVIDVTKEFPERFERIQMKIQNPHGAFYAIPLHLTRLLEQEVISEDDYLLFLGYKSTPGGKDPNTLNTSESSVYNLWAEYARMKTLVSSVIAFKKGKLTLERAQAKLNHPDFDFFVRDVALFTQVFPDLFEGVQIAEKNPDGENSPLLRSAIDSYRRGKVQLSQLVSFLGYSQNRVLKILREEQEIREAKTLIRFFSGELSYPDTAKALCCSESVANFIVKAAYLRRRQPELVPHGLAPLLSESPTAVFLARNALSIRQKNLIDEEDYELLLGKDKHPEIVARFLELEELLPDLPKIKGLYTGTFDPQTLQEHLRCSDFPDLVRRLVEAKSVLENLQLPAISLNGGHSYSRLCCMTLNAVEEGTISVEEASAFLGRDKTSINADQRKFQQLKEHFQQFEAMRKGDLSLEELGILLEKPTIPELVRYGAELSKALMLGKTSAAYQFDAASSLYDVVLSKEIDHQDLAECMGWNASSLKMFLDISKKRRHREALLDFRKGLTGFKNLQEQFGYQHPSSVIGYGASLVKDSLESFASHPLPLKDDGGSYTPTVRLCLDLLMKHEINDEETRNFLGCTPESLRLLKEDAKRFFQIDQVCALKKGTLSPEEAVQVLGCESFAALAMHCERLHEAFPGILDQQQAEITINKYRLTEFSHKIVASLIDGSITESQACLLLGGTPIRLHTLRKKFEEQRRRGSLLSWRKGLVDIEKVQKFFQCDSVLEFLQLACNYILQTPSRFKRLPARIRDKEGELLPFVVDSAAAVLSEDIDVAAFCTVFGIGENKASDVLEEAREILTSRKEALQEVDMDTENEPVIELNEVQSTALDKESVPKEQDEESDTVGSCVALGGNEAVYKNDPSLENLLQSRSQILGILKKCGAQNLAELNERISASLEETVLKWKMGQLNEKNLLELFSSSTLEELVHDLLMVIRQHPELGIDHPLEGETLSACIADLYVNEKISQEEAQMLFGCPSLMVLLQRVQPFLEHPKKKKPSNQKKLAKKKSPHKKEPKRKPKPKRSERTFTPGNKLTPEKVPESMIQAVYDWYHNEIGKEDLLRILEVGSYRAAQMKMKKIRNLFPERLKDLPEKASKQNNLSITPERIQIALQYRKGEISLAEAQKRLGLRNKESASSAIRSVVKHNPELFADLPAKIGRKKTKECFSQEDIEMAKKWRLFEITTEEACRFFAAKNELAVLKKVGAIAKRHPEDFVEIPYRYHSSEQVSQEDISMVQKYKKGEIKKEELMKHFGVSSRTTLNVRMRRVLEAASDVFTDVPIIAPRSLEITEEHIQIAHKYLQGERSAEDIFQELDLSRVDYVDSRISKIMQTCPERFEGVSIQLPQFQENNPSQLTQEHIQAAVAYRKGEISLKAARKRLGVKTVSYKVRQLAQAFPDAFADCPKERPKGRKQPIDQTSRDIVKEYLSGTLDKEEAAKKLGVSVDYLRHKITLCKERYPSDFSEFIKEPPSDEESIRIAIAYRMADISLEHALEFFDCENESTIQKKILALKEKYPDKFINVPDRRMVKPTFSSEEVDAVMNYEKGLLSFEKLCEVVAPGKSKSALWKRVRKIKTAYQDIFDKISSPERESDKSLQKIISWKKGELSHEEAMEYFQCEHRSTLGKIFRKLQAKFPKMFEDVPDERPK